jgi:hypothetical protein
MIDDKYSQFITANTVVTTQEEIAFEHLIPCHVKDNERFISHHEFINAVKEAGRDSFGEDIDDPLIRVSHPIKGRIASAKHKSAKELLPEECTLYYERMAWTVSFPQITSRVGDDDLALTIGGVKSYSMDNLYSTKDTLEQFKVFVGFSNNVCCNLCISTDGLASSLKANELPMLYQQAKALFGRFNVESELSAYNTMNEMLLTEEQFAHILGRSKLYNAMPKANREGITGLGLSDSQLSTVAEDFYKDKNHSRNADGSIDLWKMYNLFTGANKSSYADTILDRNVAIYEGVQQLSRSLAHKETSWYLN